MIQDRCGADVYCDSSSVFMSQKNSDAAGEAASLFVTSVIDTSL